MKTELYKSYGVLAHENEPVYSQHAPASDIYDRVIVDIPDEITVGVNAIDDVLVGLSGETYRLCEVLGTRGDAPALIWFDGARERHMVLTEEALE